MELGKQEIEKRLLLLDKEAELLFSDSDHFSCFIVGGSGLLLLEYISRATIDIDALEIKPKELKSIIEKYDINTDVTVFETNFADNYDQRAVRILPQTKKIDFFVLSLEDLVLSKLCSRGDGTRRKDMVDICNQKIVNNLNWDLLDVLYKEVYAQQLSVFSQEDLKLNYEQYLKDYKK